MAKQEPTDKVESTETLEENRPLDDSELKEVVSGASPEDYDEWHSLPNRSGSSGPGAGE